jgi:glycosyltransferase involved in cell wall biosynthesis
MHAPLILPRARTRCWENVVFAGLRSDVALLMAACDVFLLPSFEEPLELVFTEAMAMKRPVVILTNEEISFRQYLLP